MHYNNHLRKDGDDFFVVKCPVGMEVPNLKDNKAWYIKPRLEDRVYHIIRSFTTNDGSIEIDFATVQPTVLELKIGNSFIVPVNPEVYIEYKPKNTSSYFTYVPLYKFRLKQIVPGVCVSLSEEEVKIGGGI